MEYLLCARCIGEFNTNVNEAIGNLKVKVNNANSRLFRKICI